MIDILGTAVATAVIVGMITLILNELAEVIYLLKILEIRSNRTPHDEAKPITTPYNQRTTKPSAHQDARYIRRPRQS